MIIVKNKMKMEFFYFRFWKRFWFSGKDFYVWSNMVLNFILNFIELIRILCNNFIFIVMNNGISLKYVVWLEIYVYDKDVIY